MKILIIMYFLGAPISHIYAMQQPPALTMAKYQQLEQIKKNKPTLKRFFDTPRGRNTSGKTLEGVPYTGPKVWDIIGASIYATSKLIALADQSANAVQGYEAQQPFKMILNKPNQSQEALSALATDSFLLASTAGNTIIVWDITSQKPITTLEGHTNCISSLVFNPAIPYQLLSGSYDKTIRSWDITTGTCTQKLTENNEVLSLDLSLNNPDQLLATANTTGSVGVSLWSLSKSAKIKQEIGLYCAKYNTIGSSFITGTRGKLWLYNAATLQLIRTLTLPPDWTTVIPTSFDFKNDDSNVIVAGAHTTILSCDSQATKIQNSLETGMMGVDAHYNSDGTQILASTFGCAYDGGTTVRIFETPTTHLVTRTSCEVQ